MAPGRGRLSSFELLPPEADAIVAWAASELSDREKTQTDIYAEFVSRCEALMKEHRGELEFKIPAFSSFNRFSIRQARLSRCGRPDDRRRERTAGSSVGRSAAVGADRAAACRTPTPVPGATTSTQTLHSTSPSRAAPSWARTVQWPLDGLRRTRGPAGRT